jgi:hypothetical protein
MTRQEDALPAFSGLLNALSSSLQTDFWHGMPLAYFHQALLFSTTKASRRIEFPSWSWLGWRLDLPSRYNQFPEHGRPELDYGITINLTPQSPYNFPTENTPATELKDEVEWFRYESKDETFSYFVSISPDRPPRKMTMYTSQLPSEGNLTDLELSHMLVGDAIYRPLENLPDMNNHEAVNDASFLSVSMIQDLETQQDIGRVYFVNPSAKKTKRSLELLVLSTEVIPEGGNSFHSRGDGAGEVYNIMVVETDERGLSRRRWVRALGLKEMESIKPRATRIFLV